MLLEEFTDNDVALAETMSTTIEMNAAQKIINISEQEMIMNQMKRTTKRPMMSLNKKMIHLINDTNTKDIDSDT